MTISIFSGNAMSEKSIYIDVAYRNSNSKLISIIYIYCVFRKITYECDVFVACLTETISQIGIPARIKHSQVAWQRCLVD